jgi:hypothetical protein
MWGFFALNQRPGTPYGAGRQRFGRWIVIPLLALMNV